MWLVVVYVVGGGVCVGPNPMVVSTFSFFVDSVNPALSGEVHGSRGFREDR